MRPAPTKVEAKEKRENNVRRKSGWVNPAAVISESPSLWQSETGKGSGLKTQLALLSSLTFVIKRGHIHVWCILLVHDRT